MHTLLILLALLETTAPQTAAVAAPPRVPAASRTDAADTPPPKISEELVVTASRRETSLRDVPYSMEVLRPERLHLGRTLPEALQGIPGVAIQKTAHGQGSPYLRGFTGFRTLLLTDGVRLNNSVFRDGPNQYWSTVDPLSFGRLEIVKGPASVLYGSDAIGGTVNAISPMLDSGDEQRFRLYVRGATAERSSATRLETTGTVSERTTYRASASLKRYGDLIAGGSTGRQEKTGYGEEDLEAKVQVALSPERSLVLLHQQNRIDDAWRTHRTSFAKSWNGTTVGSDKRFAIDQERSLTYLQFHDEQPSFFLDRMDASISYQVQGELQDRVRSSGQGELQGFDVATSGAWLTGTRTTAAGLLTTGVEVYHDRVGSFSHRLDAAGAVISREIQGPVADDAAYTLAGLFFQDEIPLSARLTITAGVRLTSVSASAAKVRDPLTGSAVRIEKEWLEPTASVRFGYEPRLLPRLRVFGGVSQGFRAPNLSDLTRYDIARSKELETPSPDLEPEHFTSYETGLRMDGRVRAQLSLFHTSIDGQIVRIPTGRMLDGNYEVRKANAADGSISGIELSAALNLTRSWSLRGGASLLRGRITQYTTSSVSSRVRDGIDKLAPPSAFASVLFRPQSGRWWAELVSAAVERQEELSAADRLDTDRIPPGGTPGYNSVSLQGGVALSDRATVSVAVENILDRDYRVHGSGINAPGRNLVVAVTLVR